MEATEKKDLHGHEKLAFPNFSEDGTYLEGVTLNREQATAFLREQGFDTAKLRRVFMRYSSDVDEVQHAGGEGDEAWLECEADHPDALPFWKDAP
jgi:hypothetical protein